MKEHKEAEARLTPLDQITMQLRTVLGRRTADIIEAGNLLIKSRELLEHGQWLPWLEENFDLSERTARRYIGAAEYVASKSATVSDFSNLAPTVLYGLAAGDYTDREELEILTQAQGGTRIDEDRAWDICENLAPPLADDGDGGGHDDEAAEDSESAKILDGPPPKVPSPTAPAEPQKLSATTAWPETEDFESAVAKLLALRGKPIARFVGRFTSNELHEVADFLVAIAAADKAKAA